MKYWIEIVVEVIDSIKTCEDSSHVTNLNSRSLTWELSSSLLWEAQVLEMVEMFNKLLSFIVTFSQEPSLFLTFSVAL